MSRRYRKKHLNNQHKVTTKAERKQKAKHAASSETHVPRNKNMTPLPRSESQDLIYSILCGLNKDAASRWKRLDPDTQKTLRIIFYSFLVLGVSVAAIYLCKCLDVDLIASDLSENQLSAPREISKSPTKILKTDPSLSFVPTNNLNKADASKKPNLSVFPGVEKTAYKDKSLEAIISIKEFIQQRVIFKSDQSIPTNDRRIFMRRIKSALSKTYEPALLSKLLKAEPSLKITLLSKARYEKKGYSHASFAATTAALNQIDVNGGYVHFYPEHRLVEMLRNELHPLLAVLVNEKKFNVNREVMKKDYLQTNQFLQRNNVAAGDKLAKAKKLEVRTTLFIHPALEKPGKIDEKKTERLHAAIDQFYQNILAIKEGLLEKNFDQDRGGKALMKLIKNHYHPLVTYDERSFSSISSAERWIQDVILSLKANKIHLARNIAENVYANFEAGYPAKLSKQGDGVWRIHYHVRHLPVPRSPGQEAVYFEHTDIDLKNERLIHAFVGFKSRSLIDVAHAFVKDQLEKFELITSVNPSESPYASPLDIKEDLYNSKSFAMMRRYLEASSYIEELSPPIKEILAPKWYEFFESFYELLLSDDNVEDDVEKNNFKFS